MIRFDETELLTLFDHDDSMLSEHTDFGSHSYKYVRDDNVAISLSFNEYKDTRNISLIVSLNDVTSSFLQLDNCEIIHMLDAQKKQLEILFDFSPKLRCFIDLNGDIIITMGGL